MKNRSRNFKRVVFPLINSKKKFFSNVSSVAKSDDSKPDSGVEFESKPNVSKNEDSQRGGSKSAKKCSKSPILKTNVENQQQNVTVGRQSVMRNRLMACMEKLEKLSKRLDDASDAAIQENPNSNSSSSDHLQRKTNGKKEAFLPDEGISLMVEFGNEDGFLNRKPFRKAEWKNITQDLSKEYEAFATGSLSSGYSSASSGSPVKMEENAIPSYFHGIVQQPRGFVYQQNYDDDIRTKNSHVLSAWSTSSVEENNFYQSNGWFYFPQMMPERMLAQSDYNAAPLSYYPQPGMVCHQLGQMSFEEASENEQEFEIDYQRPRFRYRSFRYRNGERTAVPLGGVGYNHDAADLQAGTDRRSVALLPTSGLSFDEADEEVDDSASKQGYQSAPSLSEQPIYEFPSGHIEQSCMCSDCILARMSSQLLPAENSVYSQ